MKNNWPIKKIGKIILGIIAAIFVFIIILSFKNNQIFITIIWPLLCSVLAGFFVYLILEIKDRRHWSDSKLKIIENLDSTLTAVLTTIRLAAGMNPPRDLSIPQEIISFFKDSFGYISKYQILRDQLKSMDEKKRKIFLSNIQNMQEAVRFLLPIFVSFRKADSWYVKKIFELNEKLYQASVLYVTFPEICDSALDNDHRLKGIKEQAIIDIVQLADFTFNFKEELSKRA
jgi:hypothetical protein